MVDVVIRQEAIRLLNGRGEPGGLQGTVALRSFSGARVQYVVRLAGGVELVAETASHGPNAALAAGHAGHAGDRCRFGFRHGV